MATESVGIPARSVLVAERLFFFYMALACAVIAVAGFVSRYFAPMASGTFAAPSLVHIHGVAMWSWMLLFAWQAWLAAQGRLQRHRSFGMLGIGLFAVAVWVGASVGLLQLDRQLEAGAGDAARAFLAQPLSLTVTMIVLFTAAILNARRQDVHARLMLLVAFVALVPALARLTGDVLGTGPHPRNPVVAGLIVLALVGLAAARDLRARGRVHPTYLYGGGFIAVVMLARSTLNRTEAWYAVADGLRTLVH
jgi:hypothetical protein